MPIIKVNGEDFDSSNVEVVWGSTLVKCTEVGFGDGLETEDVRLLGQQRIDATTDGQYAVEKVTIKMPTSYFMADIWPLLPADGYGNYRKDLSIRISRTGQGSAITVCANARLTKQKESYAQSPGVLVTELEMTAQQLSKDGKTINRTGLNPVSGIAATLRV